jgi:dTDP-4-dehydrorhamnose 3,5-epimerase
MGLKIIHTAIKGVDVIESEPFRDNRGSFTRIFCAKELQPLLGNRSITQINHSVAINPGTIRGLHFQRPPHTEMKFIRCIRGRIFDVALDIRAGSPTFMKWHAEELSAENSRMLAVPEGCAHGFQVLEPGSELLYLHTGYYEPASEGGISYADPLPGITWPLPVADLSPRDSAHAPLDSSFKGI